MKANGTIKVWNDNVEKALRTLKKKTIESGLVMAVRDRQEFTKPSAKKRRKVAAAKQRWKKHLRDEDANIFHTPNKKRG